MIYILKVTHYFQLIFFKALEKCVYHLSPVKFLSPTGLAWQATLKKTEIELKL